MTIKARQDLVKTFVIDFTSEEDENRYQGSFTTKKLSVRDRQQLNIRRSQLNGGMYHDSDNPGRGIDPETDSINNMIAHLELSLKSAPPWWNLDEITDINLVVVVFREVLGFENSFRRKQLEREAAGSNSQGNSTGDAQASNPPAAVSQVVGKAVQSTLEP